MKEAIRDYIREKKYLFWSVGDFSNISDESVLENTLNYGDFDDVKTVISILGQQRAASIFETQIKSKRCNYRPEIANYFNLYFKKHGLRNTK